MSNPAKTAIVTGASQGIGAGIVKAFVARGFNVVASSRKMTQSTEVEASDHFARVDGDKGRYPAMILVTGATGTITRRRSRGNAGGRARARPSAQDRAARCEPLGHRAGWSEDSARSGATHSDTRAGLKGQ